MAGTPGSILCGALVTPSPQRADAGQIRESAPRRTVIRELSGAGASRPMRANGPVTACPVP